MTKLRITEADLRAMRATVERTRGQCSPEDHAHLTEMVDVLVEVRAMVLEYDADDDTPVGEELLEQAMARVRARKST